MIGKQTVLAVIPARGGSKGVPRKNLHPLGGKPLIAWTIAAAKASRYLDRVVLSSEDPEIIRVAEAHGCDAPFVRPAELAQDATPGIDPVLHALDALPGFDVVVLLQPTSPLRSAADIDGTLEQLVAEDASSCVSLCEVEESPWWSYVMQPGTSLVTPLMPDSQKYKRRQDLPRVLTLNGAVYAARTDAVRRARSFVTERTAGYVMPRDRSVDIDTPADFRYLEFLLSERGAPVS